MKVKALKSFVGKVSMDIDEEKEIIDKELANDLIRAGHVVEIKANKILEKAQKEPTEKVAEKKPTRGRKKK